MNRSKCLRRLRERRRFVRGRIDSYEANGKSPNVYDLSEVAALTFAINELDKDNPLPKFSKE